MSWDADHPPTVQQTRLVSTTNAPTHVHPQQPHVEAMLYAVSAITRPCAHVQLASQETQPELAHTQCSHVPHPVNVALDPSVLEVFVLSHVPHQMKTVCSMKSVFKEPADPCVTAMRIVTMDIFARRGSVLLVVLLTHSVARMRLV